nr:hypothetical protein I302_01551 [Kwoniella bestiolae CBS 10118]OCF30033.1 hypothetical protein I302_01551 [Kwoniella bestiolae CBS 10118]
MSANSLGTPTSARHSIGGGNGGSSMILSSTRIKQPTSSNGGGLTSSRSMGNLRGSSEGLSSTPGGGKSTKKKNKKGMKGWAWVVEDENGNIVDAPDLDVEEQPAPALVPQQQASTISREGGIGEDDVTVVEDGTSTGNGNGNTSSIHQLINQENKPISRQSNNTTLQNDGDLYASSPLPSRASTATAEIIPSKRVRKSSSPLTAYTPRENNNNNNDGELSRLLYCVNATPRPLRLDRDETTLTTFVG